LRNHLRTLIGLNFIALAMCELVSWPPISWAAYIMPGGLMSAGAALIGGEIAGDRAAGRPEINGQHSYWIQRILGQGGGRDGRRPS